MKACVLIEVDDQGQVSVGSYPGDLPPELKQSMQPAQSVDDALAQAKQLLEHFDKDKNGSVNFEEFLQAIKVSD